jgi:hypothetical protein
LRRRRDGQTDEVPIAETVKQIQALISQPQQA